MPQIVLAQVEVAHDMQASPAIKFRNLAEILIRIEQAEADAMCVEHFYPIRGYPEDMAHRSRLNLERASRVPRSPVYPTWLTYQEATAAFQRMRVGGMFCQSPEFDAMMTYISTLYLSGCYQQVRLVFWLQF